MAHRSHGNVDRWTSNAVWRDLCPFRCAKVRETYLGAQPPYHICYHPHSARANCVESVLEALCVNNSFGLHSVEMEEEIGMLDNLGQHVSIVFQFRLIFCVSK